jgi:hypothetical protein
MENSSSIEPWSLTKKITFRFLFIFFFMMTSLWSFIPVVGDWLYTYAYYPSFFVQNYILGLHQPYKWVHPPTGSGDTLDDWIMVMTYIVVAIICSLVWSLFDKKHTHHTRLHNWLQIGLIYYLAYVLFGYGIQKLFVLQMPYPSMAQFYTPLGDFTPMRFSWMFIGYSAPYQFFGGFLETLGALLILFRRTRLLGLMILFGVMGNVVLLNFCYGIPVKYYSAFLWLIGIYLTVPYIPSILNFFFHQQRIEAETLPTPYTKKWQRYTRIGLKVAFVVYAIGMTTYQNYSWSNMVNDVPPLDFNGAFDVHSFKRNGVEVLSAVDTTRWNQIIVGEGYQPGEGRGTIKRGTSNLNAGTFTVDSLKNLTVTLRGDTAKLFKGTYAIENKDRFIWKGQLKQDSVEMVLQRNERKFTLANRKFKWVLEQNDF